MQALNAYLAVANVNAWMEILERAFGFSRGVVLAGTVVSPATPRCGTAIRSSS